MKMNTIFKCGLCIWGAVNVILIIYTFIANLGYKNEFFWSLEFKYITVAIFSFALAWVIDMIEDIGSED